METESEPTDESGIGIPLSRRGFLGVLGASAGAGVAASQSDSGVLSLGGSTGEQESVQTQDILVVFGEEQHSVSGSESYHGAELRADGELVLEEGAELTFESIAEH